MQAESADSPYTSEMVTDILVMGSGAAGLSASLFAAAEGLTVVVCEKSDQIGGTTATSAGTVWVPGSRNAEQAGLSDSRAAVETYLDGELRGFGGGDLRRAYLESAPEAIEQLEKNSDVKFLAAARHPDYHDGPGSTQGGRALVPAPFDGRLLGDDFRLIRPPIKEFLLLGGMMVNKDDITHLINRFRSWRSFRHSVALVTRYCLDRLRYPRGTRLVMGNALVGRLFNSLRQKRSITLRLGWAVSELIMQDGRVTGAVITKGDGRCVIRARLGVVLAGGGFPQGQGLRAELMPARAAGQRSLGFAGNTGDGIRLARQAGGTVESDHDVPAFLVPVSVMRRNDGSEAVFPHIYLDRAKPGVIAVNRHGLRFINEADSYHDVVLAMYRTEDAIPAYLICGAGFIEKYGMGMVPPGATNFSRFVDAGYLLEAFSIGELAGKIGVPGVALEATIERYNRDAAKGIDSDYGRGSTELNRFNGDPEQQPNPCVGPIKGPRYFAMAMWPGDIGTSTGIRTDENGVVLNARSEPIAGLYACGNDMSSVMRGRYPGPGITLGPAITFSYRAVMHAAGRPRMPGRNIP